MSSFIFLLFNFLLNTGLEYINKVYNPNHFAVTSTVSSVLQIVCSSIMNKEYLPLHLIGNVFVLVGCIMYNEIVIFHFVHLEQNTRREIVKRSEKETKMIYNLVYHDNDSSVDSDY